MECFVVTRSFRTDVYGGREPSKDAVYLYAYIDGLGALHGRVPACRVYEVRLVLKAQAKSALGIAIHGWQWRFSAVCCSGACALSVRCHLLLKDFLSKSTKSTEELSPSINAHSNARFVAMQSS